MMGQFGADGLCIPFRARYDEKRVIARQGSHYVFPLQCIKHLAGCIGHTGVALNKHHMASIVHAPHRFMEDGLKPSLYLGIISLCPAGYVAVSLGGCCLDQAQLSDIPRDRCLRYSKPLLTQMLQQGLLAADGVFLDQAQDGLQTLSFGFHFRHKGLSPLVGPYRRRSF